MKLNAKTLDDITAWFDELNPLKLSEILDQADSKNVAIVSVDMINGFCYEGALSSPRVGDLAESVADAFKEAYEKFAVKNLILIQDSHKANSVEFDAFPPHAVAGTKEVDTIEAIRNLSFFDEIKIYYKNSISSAYCDKFNNFLSKNPQIDTFIVLGDCTDLCVYHLASHLKLSANEANIKRRVIVPANLVQTYDAPWHDGDFYHLVFLRHMQLAANIEVVKSLEI